MNKRSAAEVCEQPDICPVAGACGREGAVPCVEMNRAHERKLGICDALEAIADDLPSSIDRFRCLEVASSLVPLLRECHRYEEEIVYPAFEIGGPTRGAASTVKRLRAEHVEDECAAQDLSEALLAIGHGEAVSNPEALGFMLRAFFEGVRRHVAFEQEHVLPLMHRSGASH